MKKQNGMNMIMLTIVICIIIVLVSLIVVYTKNRFEQEEFENIKTDMLSVQAKVKVIGQTSITSKDESVLIGIKVSENLEDEDIKKLIEKGIIETEEDVMKNYYIIDKQNLIDMELSIKYLNEGKIIVNYSTNEVIYSKGIKVRENMYYKLSDIQDLDKTQINKETKIEENEVQEQEESNE